MKNARSTTKLDQSVEKIPISIFFPRSLPVFNYIVVDLVFFPNVTYAIFFSSVCMIIFCDCWHDNDETEFYVAIIKKSANKYGVYNKQRYCSVC